MKTTRSLIRKLIKEAIEKKKEVKNKDIDNAIKSCLKKEGGAAGLGMLVKVVQGLETDKKDLPSNLSTKEKIENYIKRHKDFIQLKHKDIVLKSDIPMSKLNEELERLQTYKKYDYGVDNVPSDKRKEYDNIIGHTWLTHVKRKGSALNEVGYVLWHSLNESGDIKYYDVEWPKGNIETNIPAFLLEKVKDSDDISEVHESHGTKGHEENLEVSERKYKKKNKSLYPYVFYGYLDKDNAESDSFDSGGFDIGGE